MDMFILEHEKTLTKEQRKMALGTIMFPNKKRDRELKGCTFKDGSVERESYEKFEISSNVVATKSVLLATINSYR